MEVVGVGEAMAGSRSVLEGNKQEQVQEIIASEQCDIGDMVSAKNTACGNREEINTLCLGF